jgi:hypothetical protein
MQNIQYTGNALKDPQEEFLQQVKGECLDRVHSDQMALRTFRWEAGPRERWTKTHSEEMENNSRKPRDLFGKRHSDSLKRVNLLFLRLDEKGNDVADDEDDDAVRTRPSNSNTVC